MLTWVNNEGCNTRILSYVGDWSKC